MANETIKKILENHSVPAYESNGRVFASEEWLQFYGENRIPVYNWIDVTGWTREQVYDWLGY